MPARVPEKGRAFSSITGAQDIAKKKNIPSLLRKGRAHNSLINGGKIVSLHERRGKFPNSEEGRGRTVLSNAEKKHQLLSRKPPHYDEIKIENSREGRGREKGGKGCRLPERKDPLLYPGEGSRCRKAEKFRLRERGGFSHP